MKHLPEIGTLVRTTRDLTGFRDSSPYSGKYVAAGTVCIVTGLVLRQGVAEAAVLRYVKRKSMYVEMKLKVNLFYVSDWVSLSPLEQLAMQ